ncbi:MAG: hypothetical protein ACRC9F_00910, partial [Metamycoplasmataceae bacterium]
IAFIAILIATSIAFVVIGAQAAALSSLPTIKLSLAGLPVKITGFLFGPLIGFAIGFITDIITFLFVPVFYNPIYSVVLGITGMIPGIFAWFYFVKFNPKFANKNQIKKINIKKIQLNHKLILEYRNNSNNNMNIESNKARLILERMEKLDKKITLLKSDDTKETRALNFNLISSVIFILLISMSFTVFLNNVLTVELLTSAFEYIAFLQEPIVFLAFVWMGFSLILAFLIICRFTMKSSNYLKMVPLLMFIVLTEFINLPLVSIADEAAVGINFWISFLVAFAASPVKIWMNLLIISFATKIVTPLILGKQSNSYI